MNTHRKDTYAEPLLLKHEQLRDITAGGTKYKEKLVVEKFNGETR